jgi:hypothetical protein
VLGHFTLVHFFAIDDDVWRGGYTEADLVAAEADHGDDDVAPDAQGFIGTAAEDEHVFTPCQAGMVRQARRIARFAQVTKPSPYSMTRIGDAQCCPDRAVL